MSIEFVALQVGQLQSNCYVLWDSQTRKAAVIDPGDDLDFIKSKIDSLSIDVEWVLLTHGHFDHVFYAGDIAAAYGARIGMQALDVVQVTQTLTIAEQFYDTASFRPFEPTDLLNEGDSITLGSSTISVLHTPGHSQGGLCFVTDVGVFCGDTIFAQSVGRSDFPGGSHEQLISSIRTKILSLDDSTPLYPGHGISTTVGDERRDNYYLR